MLIQEKAYCTHCNSKEEYQIRTNTRSLEVNEVIFDYSELEAHCKKCQNLVYVPAVNDRNVYARKKAYYDKLFKLAEGTVYGL